MENQLPENVVTCTQCGGELHPDEGQIFLTCPFCSSTVYIDKAHVVFHWYLAPTLDESKARAALARWMAGNQTVKDLDQKARITEAAFQFFPMWYFKRRQAGGREEIDLMPGAATAVSEIVHLPLPAGDLRKYTQDVEPQALPPTVPLEAALSWLNAGRPVPAGEIVEQSLVHIPLYSFKYTYQGKTYTAIVEGGTGEVFANIYPAKAEAPYRLVGGLAALVFLCLALFPVVGGIANGSGGAAAGFGLCAGAGLIAAPLLFLLAAWVAAKI
jgi:predicted RNA-binding Zn-ribbon protein involved in translation (DUF1610 family)